MAGLGLLIKIQFYGEGALKVGVYKDSGSETTDHKSNFQSFFVLGSKTQHHVLARKYFNV